MTEKCDKWDKWEPYKVFDLPAHTWKRFMMHSWNHLVQWAKSLNKNELIELHDRFDSTTTPKELKKWSKEKLYDYFLNNSLDTIKNFLLPLQIDPVAEKYSDMRENLETKSFDLYKNYYSRYKTTPPTSNYDIWHNHIRAFKVSSSFLTKSIHQMERKIKEDESHTASILFFIAIMVTVTIDVLEELILLYPDCVTDDYSAQLKSDFTELVQSVFEHLKQQTESGYAPSKYYDLLRSKAQDIVNSHPYSKLNNYLTDQDKELRIKLHTIRWLALLTTEMVNKRILDNQ